MYLNLHRYKIVVEVVIGEQRGEGVRMGTRCLWDSDTDSYASDVFMNDSLFCCAAAFGIYYYQKKITTNKQQKQQQQQSNFKGLE